MIKMILSVKLCFLLYNYQWICYFTHVSVFSSLSSCSFSFLISSFFVPSHNILFLFHIHFFLYFYLPAVFYCFSHMIQPLLKIRHPWTMGSLLLLFHIYILLYHLCCRLLQYLCSIWLGHKLCPVSLPLQSRNVVVWELVTVPFNSYSSEGLGIWFLPHHHKSQVFHGQLPHTRWNRSNKIFKFTL